MATPSLEREGVKILLTLSLKRERVDTQSVSGIESEKRIIHQELFTENTSKRWTNRLGGSIE